MENTSARDVLRSFVTGKSIEAETQDRIESDQRMNQLQKEAPGAFRFGWIMVAGIPVGLIAIIPALARVLAFASGTPSPPTNPALAWAVLTFGVIYTLIWGAVFIGAVFIRDLSAFVFGPIAAAFAIIATAGFLSFP